jgi:hypothetical protein
LWNYAFSITHTLNSRKITKRNGKEENKDQKYRKIMRKLKKEKTQERWRRKKEDGEVMNM